MIVSPIQMKKCPRVFRHYVRYCCAEDGVIGRAPLSAVYEVIGNGVDSSRITPKDHAVVTKIYARLPD